MIASMLSIYIIRNWRPRRQTKLYLFPQLNSLWHKLWKCFSLIPLRLSTDIYTRTFSHAANLQCDEIQHSTLGSGDDGGACLYVVVVIVCGDDMVVCGGSDCTYMEVEVLVVVNGLAICACMVAHHSTYTYVCVFSAVCNQWPVIMHILMSRQLYSI